MGGTQLAGWHFGLRYCTTSRTNSAIENLELDPASRVYLTWPLRYHWKLYFTFATISLQECVNDFKTASGPAGRRQLGVPLSPARHGLVELCDSIQCGLPHSIACTVAHTSRYSSPVAATTRLSPIYMPIAHQQRLHRRPRDTNTSIRIRIPSRPIRLTRPAAIPMAPPARSHRCAQPLVPPLMPTPAHHPVFRHAHPTGLQTAPACKPDPLPPGPDNAQQQSLPAARPTSPSIRPAHPNRTVWGIQEVAKTPKLIE